jgi:acetolactate synthase-1/2/3 large subunit
VANECLRAADLVLALGVKFDFHGTGFEYGILPQGAKLVHVSRHPQFLGASFPATRALLAPVGHFLRGLSAAVAHGAPPPRDPTPWMEKLGAWRGNRDAQAQDLRAATPLKPQWVAAALSPYGTSGSFFTFDGGNFKKFLVRGMEFAAGGLLFKDDGYGCVGSALPTALGYKAGRADCRVFCVTGDMGYLVNGGELETAVRENLPIVTIIFNDGGLGNIREYQARKYGGRHIGVDYAPVDYAAAARAFGAHGERVVKPEEVEPAIRRALESGKPAVLDMVVDPGELAPKG